MFRKVYSHNLLYKMGSLMIPSLIILLGFYNEFVIQTITSNFLATDVIPDIPNPRLAFSDLSKHSSLKH